MPGARLPEHPGPGGPGLGRANVLLVDDRAANLLALEEVLRPLGQHLVRATSGHEALRCLLRDDFAVILLDVHMPGLDGFETAAQIKQRERSRHIPIIFLTAVSRDPHQALQGYSAGAVDYLSTPFDPAVLRSKVSVFVDLYLERRRAQAAEQALSHQAFHDSLTKLPNRALLLDRLTHALARQERRPGDTAVLFVDIDRFKWVNDSLGHAVGDELLVAIAERLQTVVRAGDTVGRFGGDEFVVLCEELGDDEDVAAVAERLARAVGEPFEVHDQTIAVTASIGIALARAVGRDTAEALLRDADTAMYRAKERGRDGIEVFDQGMRSRVLVRLETAKSLRRAVDRGELRVHYQPVIELGTGAVVGVEALLRWEDPVRGLVPPSDFVPVAEENGLILPIGAFVLVEACRQVSRWNRAHPGRAPLTASVNLSARQLASDSLGPLVGEVLADSGLDPTTLCLEITESVLVEDVAANRSALESLRDLGVRVAVDDFGTGYSSLL
jgi:diguanylate cyclase (GGDEF)-like protein